MDIKIADKEYMWVLPCTCRTHQFPKFKLLNDYSTDVYLYCQACGRRTKNTSEYWYVTEISLTEAKRDAVREWNKMNEEVRNEMF